MRYLLDTNVVVDILRDNSSVTERYLYEQLHNGRLIEDNDIYIAAISMVNGCNARYRQRQSFRARGRFEFC